MARMEDVLDLYHEDYDPDHPVVCFDETSKQLVADKRPSIGARPGRVERYDYEYKRNGTRNLFMFCEPKAGWRHVEVTERRTAVDASCAPCPGAARTRGQPLACSSLPPCRPGAPERTVPLCTSFTPSIELPPTL